MKFRIQEYDNNGNLAKDTIIHLPTRKQAIKFCETLETYTRHSITLEAINPKNPGNVVQIAHIPKKAYGYDNAPKDHPDVIGTL
ncbi:MAG: hypothetical protein H6550_16275 [Chitinophagales bacterium]|nr:hypothetical protein [Chitinophagales bacterium]